MTYASSTSVPVGKTRSEIERLLTRYGADAFSYATDMKRAAIQFRMQGKIVRYHILLPETEDFRFTPKRRKRSDSGTQKEWEQACRQRWRALLLITKAKLEAIEAHISSFEEEFLAWILLPDSRSVGEYLLPQIEHAYTTGEMPHMLPSGVDK